MQTAQSWPRQEEDWGKRAGLWLARIRDWLDARGRVAWFAAMLLGFFVFWPIGLAILAYMIWSNRMGFSNRSQICRHRRVRAASTGNAAFDAYREETLQRLEEERDAFVAFLDELRSAKDRAEFDQFMAQRSAPSTENPA